MNRSLAIALLCAMPGCVSGMEAHPSAQDAGIASVPDAVSSQDPCHEAVPKATNAGMAPAKKKRAPSNARKGLVR